MLCQKAVLHLHFFSNGSMFLIITLTSILNHLVYRIVIYVLVLIPCTAMCIGLCSSNKSVSTHIIQVTVNKIPSMWKRGESKWRKEDMFKCYKRHQVMIACVV